MVNERVEMLKSLDGTYLKLTYYTPSHSSLSLPTGPLPTQGQLKGMVLFLHGFGEHSGRYRDLAKSVCESGIAFVTFDWRGHGGSGPTFGDAQNAQAFLVDAVQVWYHSRHVLGFEKSSPNRSLLVGHSFGGLLACYLANLLKSECPPLFLTNPCLKTAQVVPFWKQLAAQAFSQFLPTVRVPIGIDVNHLSLNSQNNLQYKSDPFVLQSVTTRLGQSFIELMETQNVENLVKEWHPPVTILLGQKDTLVDASYTSRLFQTLAENSKAKLITIENAGHEIFFENHTPRSQGIEIFLSWIHSQLPS
jgi:acylglycerol lipase